MERASSRAIVNEVCERHEPKRSYGVRDQDRASKVDFDTALVDYTATQRSMHVRGGR